MTTRGSPLNRGGAPFTAASDVATLGSSSSSASRCDEKHKVSKHTRIDGCWQHWFMNKHSATHTSVHLLLSAITYAPHLLQSFHSTTKQNHGACAIPQPCCHPSTGTWYYLRIKNRCTNCLENINFHPFIHTFIPQPFITGLKTYALVCLLSCLWM